MEEAVAKLLEQNAQINTKLEMLCGLLPKVEEINTKIQSLATENAALRQDIADRDAKIDQLTSHVNKLDQASRSTSLRILGLPISPTTPSSAVPEIVYKEVIIPCIEAAIASGEISAQIAAFPPSPDHLQRVCPPGQERPAFLSCHSQAFIRVYPQHHIPLQEGLPAQVH